MDINAQLDARQARRMASNARAEARLVRREALAESMLGQVVRDGKIVWYAWPQGGKYREGNPADLISFLIRNKYA